ncbi:MAG: TetR/AcrR family transcriptional regulator [Acidimicrobiia bacterium]
MSEPVKTRRPYSSPRHNELRRQTRRAVIDAARKLFAKRGYSATTIDSLAAEAGVAVQTVYAAFGNKRSVLQALLDTVVAGDDEQRTVLERARADLDRITDPAQRLDRVLRFGTEIVERSADIYRILRGAAAGDQDLQADLEEGHRRRYQDVRAFIELVVDGQLSTADLDHVADVCFAIFSYETYELLVDQRGWSTERWRRWVHDALNATLSALSG